MSSNIIEWLNIFVRYHFTQEIFPEINVRESAILFETRENQMMIFEQIVKVIIFGAESSVVTSNPLSQRNREHMGYSEFIQDKELFEKRPFCQGM